MDRGAVRRIFSLFMSAILDIISSIVEAQEAGIVRRQMLARNLRGELMSFTETENNAELCGEAMALEKSSGAVEKGQFLTFGRYPRFAGCDEADYYYEESYSEETPCQISWNRKNTFANVHFAVFSGFEPIEWQVLETDGKTALLVSRYVVFRRNFDACNYNAEAVHNRIASLELFLNEDFMAAAFTEEERQRIVPCKIRHEIYKRAGKLGGNRDIGIINIDDENFAQDSALIKVEYIFSLSLKEALYYFKDDVSRKCGLRNSAKGAESYWLRDFADLSGEKYGYGYIGLLESKYKDGCGQGMVVDEFGALSMEAIDECLGVRPVMRITL